MPNGDKKYEVEQPEGQDYEREEWSKKAKEIYQEFLKKSEIQILALEEEKRNEKIWKWLIAEIKKYPKISLLERAELYEEVGLELTKKADDTEKKSEIDRLTEIYNSGLTQFNQKMAKVSEN